jgi:penicillin-binding protein 1A
MFILAAALQAGATPDDVIDGTHPCLLPNVGNPDEPTFQIRGGVNGGIDTLRRHTVRSINCAFARTSQIVGLNRMVDTVYRMARNPYLYEGQPATDREPIQPFASFATGGNELSTLDMAAGIQSIANEGVHHEPYYVESIDDAFGNRIYTHSSPGVQVLDRNVALTTIDVMKGVLTGGTARQSLSDFASRVPAFGKTGTQQSNWTAFFVGATPELATAVMVRDPDRYTPMTDIPEFLEAGVPRVQGGTFPARIWGAYNEAVALGQLGGQFDFADWDRPDPPPRGPARLYLPGNECLYEIIGFEVPETVPPDESAPPVEGFRAPAAPPATDPPTTDPPSTDPPTATTVPAETVPETTVPPTPIFGQVESGTTIPPDVLDPNAPLPSAPVDQLVRPCG